MNTYILWIEWFRIMLEFRNSCSRERAFLWLLVNAAGMTVRGELAGVTSFVRACWLQPHNYYRLLHNFHSNSVSVEKLTLCWMRVCLKIFSKYIYTVNNRIVLVCDGIKAPKEGKKMPAVKSLHQSSNCNAKAEFIMGHSCQSISLICSKIDDFIAVPLASRIHEGIVYCNCNRKTLLDKIVDLLLLLINDREFYLVADSYYASKKVILPLLGTGNHLVSRCRTNVVGYMPGDTPSKKEKGRPRKYGEKILLRNEFNTEKMIAALSPVYHEEKVTIQYRSLQLLWRPLGRPVQFILVQHPTRGRIILISSDLSLEPIKVIELYGLRFKIEVGFRQAVNSLGSYSYHFWMQDMIPIKRGSKDQYLHKKTKNYRQLVRRKFDAYHRYIQIATIVQGILLFLAYEHPQSVWAHFRSWLRTIKPNLIPSEMVVSIAMRNIFPDFLHNFANTNNFAKFMLDKIDQNRCPDSLRLDLPIAA